MGTPSLRCPDLGGGIRGAPSDDGAFSHGIRLRLCQHSERIPRGLPGREWCLPRGQPGHTGQEAPRPRRNRCSRVRPCCPVPPRGLEAGEGPQGRDPAESIPVAGEGESLLETRVWSGARVAGRRELAPEGVPSPRGSCRRMQGCAAAEVAATLGRGLWGLVVPLDRHGGRRARCREGKSRWIQEFGTSGVVFLQISPFASVSPGATAASRVRRDVSVAADGIRCQVGRVSPQRQG